jgi:hypothetical protein
MRALALNPEDLRVESFATGPAAHQAHANPRGPTQNPMDCPETLPRFCTPTSLC